jgi:Stc1 domain
MKTCTKCQSTKPLTDFHRSNRATGERTARGGMGVAAQCKQCRAEARKPGIIKERMQKAVLAQSGQKHCARCKEVKPLSDFSVRKASKDGRAYMCAPCVAQHCSDWREKNPEAFKGWYEINKERRADYWREWYENNKAHRAISYARWAKQNPHIINSLIAKRTARKLQATPPWANEGAIRAIYAEATRLTRKTGIRHEVDHIYPLQSNVVCGLHCEANLQILPKIENIRKGNRMPEKCDEGK